MTKVYLKIAWTISLAVTLLLCVIQSSNAFAQSIGDVRANDELNFRTQNDRIDIVFSFGGFSNNVNEFVATIDEISAPSKSLGLSCTIKQDPKFQDCSKAGFLITRMHNVIAMNMMLPSVDNYTFQLMLTPVVANPKTQVPLPHTVHNIKITRAAPPQAYSLKPIQTLKLSKLPSIPILKQIWSKINLTHPLTLDLHLSAENSQTRKELLAMLSFSQSIKNIDVNRNPRHPFACAKSDCNSIKISKPLSQTSNIVFPIELENIGNPGEYLVDVDIIDPKGLSTRQTQSFTVSIKEHFSTAAVYILIGVLIFGVMRKYIFLSIPQQTARRELITARKEIFQRITNEQNAALQIVEFSNELNFLLNQQIYGGYKTLKAEELSAYKRLPEIFKAWLDHYKIANDAQLIVLRDIAIKFTRSDVTPTGVETCLTAIKAIVPNLNRIGTVDDHKSQTRNMLQLWLLGKWTSFRLFILISFDLIILTSLAVTLGVVTLWATDASWGSYADIFAAIVWGAGVNFLSTTDFINSDKFSAT